MDPLGNVPFFIASMRNVDPSRHIYVIVRELLIAYGVMVAFLFAGRPMLGVLMISEPALTISGGVILFLIAVRMVFPTTEHTMREGMDGEPFIVPLAIPYVAGPSVLATELLLTSREPDRMYEWWGALSVAWAGTALILLASSALRHYLGQRVLLAMERLMGMILVAIAVQMLLTGIEKFIAHVGGANV